MKELAGKVVAITGASSGIGLALAAHFAEHGTRLALADVDEKGLRRTAGMINRTGPAVSTHLVDVGDHAAVQRFAAEVQAIHGGADVIVNNAGVACMAAVEDATLDDFTWVLGVNLWGTIHGVKAFLPLLKQRPSGHIVNIASVNAYLPFPRNGPYNVSKFGVDALSQTLMEEFRGSPIRISCVYLGVAKTNIARHSRYATDADATDFEGRARLTPETAARTILHGIKKDREVIIVGLDARAAAMARRVAPNLTRRALALAWERLAPSPMR